MIDEIIVFGAGKVGKEACNYYENKKEIKCIIDNKECTWGTFLEGVPVHPPQILNTYDLSKVRVVIAVKNDWKEIQEQLFTDYNVSESILFQIDETYLQYTHQNSQPDCTRQELIICYSGGLGNQMFQYALARCFIKSGNRVTGDCSDYNFWGEGRFELPFVFPGINIKKCDNTLKLYYEKVIGCRYTEAVAGKVDCLRTDMGILEKKQGVIRGYWQNYKYPEMVKRELRHDFKFKSKEDIGFCKIKNDISIQNAVSIHIRRGDYLKCPYFYGNICTDEYYNKAINYISQRMENIYFYFFSDDIEWVKEKYGGFKNAVFVDESMFDDYEDWYDMNLMSLCKHNIIANSTFSWWGAWLNESADKIVIAPQKWINGTDIPDIYPADWISI